MPTERPNILFIQCDQLTADTLGVYGNPIAATPHIDALGERGVVFDSAYTNFPLCAPSRFSMLSGQLTSRIGAYDNAAEFPSSVPTMAHYLRAEGYQTSLVGKMHFVGADQLHGFEERLTTDIYPADFAWTGDWTDIRAEFANDPRSFTQAGVCVRNVQMDYDDEVAHRAERKLYDLVRSDDERPFFMLVSFTHPHDPYQCTQSHWDRYHHDDIELPKVPAGRGEQMHPHTLRLRKQTGLHGFEMSDEQLRTARHAYMGSVSYVDDQVGRLLELLRVTDLDRNTVVVFTTDHGDMLGEHGLWYKKNFFESACRVPLLVHSPVHQFSGRIGHNVSLVDLLPTLLEVAGAGESAEPVEPIDGRSLCALMRHETLAWDDVAVSEMLAESALAPQVMLKRGGLKYICSRPDPEQLYDIEADPLEIDNLAGKPEHESTRASLAAEVQARWDLDALAEAVLTSQRRRLFLRKVLAMGKRPQWDFQARDEAAEHCLRGAQSYNEWCYADIVPLSRKVRDRYPGIG